MQLLISILLRETFGLTLTPVNKSQLVQMAGEILGSFWMLRFDEIIFALKSGINGDYGVVYGHINYQHVASWLNKYMDGRGKMISDIRDKDHERATSKHEAMEALKGIPSEFVEKIALKSESQPTTNRVTRPAKEIAKSIEDGEKLVAFEKYKKNMRPERMAELRDEAEANGWKRTMDAVNEALKHAASFTIRSLALKIRAGITEFTPSEMQAQKNNAKELETELKRLADADTKKGA